MVSAISNAVQRYVDDRPDKATDPYVVTTLKTSLQQTVEHIAMNIFLELLDQVDPVPDDSNTDEFNDSVEPIPFNTSAVPLSRYKVPHLLYGTALEVNLLRSILAEKFFLTTSFRAVESDGATSYINLYKEFNVEGSDKGSYWRFVVSWITLPEINDVGDISISLNIRPIDESVSTFVSMLATTDAVVKAHIDLYSRQIQHHIKENVELFRKLTQRELLIICFKATPEELKMFSQEMLRRYTIIITAKPRPEGHHHDPGCCWNMDEALGSHQHNPTAKCHHIYLPRGAPSCSRGGAAGSQQLLLSNGNEDIG